MAMGIFSISGKPKYISRGKREWRQIFAGPASILFCGRYVVKLTGTVHIDLLLETGSLHVLMDPTGISLCQKFSTSLLVLAGGYQQRGAGRTAHPRRPCLR